ncbi:MAG: ABC transporter substrate-binding protein [Saprospiraceae bacterium]
MKKFFFYALVLALTAHCTPRRAPAPPRPGPSRPLPGRPLPSDTIRWTKPTGEKPPIGEPGSGKPGAPTGSGATFQIGLLLPFGSIDPGEVASRNIPALQFYAGARLALEKIVAEGRINIVADVWDTGLTDESFNRLLANPRVGRAQAYIGPFRPSQVRALAEITRAKRQIIVSPEVSTPDLTRNDPDFIQMTPTLKAYCEAVALHALQTHSPDQIVLVHKSKESERAEYCQQAARQKTGGRSLRTLSVPDNAANFEKVDLRSALSPGKSTAFIVPAWSQDYVASFLAKLTAVKGGSQVVVYGMPQWRQFEQIEDDYFRNLQVRLPIAAAIRYEDAQTRDFQKRFFETYGTIPDDDAFNGYDSALFLGEMLRKHGLGFTEKLATESFKGLRGTYCFRPVGMGPDRAGKADYWENIQVQVLRFGPKGWE